MTSLIPDEEVKQQGQVNLAPMVDFLFLIVAVFATLTITRSVLQDSEINLVQVPSSNKEGVHTPSYTDPHLVVLSVTEEGNYKWISEFNEYLMQSVAAIPQELAKRQNLGVLPKEKEKIKVLLQIDKTAKWEAIAPLIFAVREAGFPIHPLYEPMDPSSEKLDENAL